jgi:hypothetical protein
MGTPAASWYIPGEGNQPAGPFTAEQLFQSWRTGKLSDTSKCWREGMTQWLPLAQVEPFASAIRSAGASRHATPEAMRAGALPKDKSALPIPAKALPKRSKGPLILVCTGGAVALLAIVAGCHWLCQCLWRVEFRSCCGRQGENAQSRWPRRSGTASGTRRQVRFGRMKQSLVSFDARSRRK